MFELVVGEIDAILGELDESQDFAALVLDPVAGPRGPYKARANSN